MEEKFKAKLSHLWDVFLWTCTALFFIVVCFTSQIETDEEINNKLIERVCKSYNVTCQIVYVDSEVINASANPETGVIYVSSGLQKMLDKEQLNSVLLHEVGHIVLKHNIREAEQAKIMPHSRCAIRRGFEQEADIFAALTAKQFGVKYRGIDAFNKLIRIQDGNVEGCSHPSVNSRIKVLEMLHTNNERN